MARPLKCGLDYFELDTKLDVKFELIEAEFGITGFGVVVKLFQMIYGGQGYYLEWDSEVALLFAKKNGLGGNAVSEIVNSAIKRNIFDEKLFTEYHILTSRGIQKHYSGVASRRVKNSIKSEYNLVENVNSRVNADKNRVSDINNPVSAVRKYTEERRGDKTRLDERRGEGARAPTPPPTLEEITAFCGERGNSVNPQRFFDYYAENGWETKNGKPVSDWKKNVVKWENNEFSGLDKSRNAIKEHSYNLDEIDKFALSNTPKVGD